MTIGGTKLRRGEVLLGRFRVDGLLGEGGMGTVYLAWHLSLDMPVAIKVIRAPLEQSAQLHIRLQREARAIARLRSEYVCRPLDFGSLESGEPFLVMEYLQGIPLSQYARARHDLSHLVDLALQTAAGLAEAHRFGLIHRDVKPSNILVTGAPGSRCIAKLVDFGLAKALDFDTVITGAGQVLGTPEFMSPEQAMSSPDVDFRTDVWSLGVVLHWLVTGTMPFDGATRMRMLTSILHDEPNLAHAAWAQVPALRETVALCLVKAPERRLKSVAAFAERLEPFAGEEGRIAASIVKATLTDAWSTTHGTPPDEAIAFMGAATTAVSEVSATAETAATGRTQFAQELRTPRPRGQGEK
ncbi:MAG: serine/threonine protein kinase [Polyangiaceae bacterium]|nr:serine/threonine protein kinase [Polyangiaceae bacterium]